LLEGLDAPDPGVRILEQSRIGPILCGDKGDLGGGPPVMAVVIQNTSDVLKCFYSGSRPPASTLSGNFSY
jgi:hypothetical protein